MTTYTIVDSPIGDLTLIGDGEALTGLWMANGRGAPAVSPSWTHDPTVFASLEQQLKEYFAGDRTEFAVAVQPAGSPFELAVWRALQAIPYGETVTYGEVAEEVGRTGAARAVGGAVGRNPISIVVPCHRVIGANRTITGYGGGLDRKRHLLALEGVSGVRG